MISAIFILVMLTYIIFFSEFKIGIKKDSINTTEKIDVNNDNMYDLSFEKILGQLDDERPWLPLEVSDEGIIYGVTGRNKNGEYELLSYDTISEQISIIDTIQDELRPVYLKENDNYIVWIEGIYQYERQETRIKLYSKFDKTIITLFEDQSYLSLDASPLSLGEDFILWVDYKYEDEKMYPIIRKYTVSTGETSVYKENATSPVILDNSIAFISADKSDEMLSSVYVESLENNNIKQVIEGNRVSHINGKGDSVIISYRDNTQEYYLATYENGQVDIIKKNNKYAYEYPKISEKYICWQAGGKTEVYNRITKENIVVDKSIDLSTASVSDNYVIATSPAILIEEQKKYAQDYGMVLSNIYINN